MHALAMHRNDNNTWNRARLAVGADEFCTRSCRRTAGAQSVLHKRYRPCTNRAARKVQVAAPRLTDDKRFFQFDTFQTNFDPERITR